MVDIYGKSLVSTEGNEWRRHVAVAGPAFGEALNSLVWKETLRLMRDWFTDELDSTPFDCRVPGSGSVIKVDMLSKMTQLTLHVIAVSGFGLRMPWKAFSNMHQHARHSIDKILHFIEVVNLHPNSYIDLLLWVQSDTQRFSPILEVPGSMFAFDIQE